MKMKQLIATTTVAASVAWGTSAPAAEYELDISTMFPSTHFIQTLALEKWAEEIEERTDGRVAFTFHPAGSSLGDATRQFDQVRSGVVDVSVGIPAIPRGRHPRTTLIELPFTVPDSDVGTCALMEVQDQLKPDFPGTKILSLTVTEPSAAHTTERISSLDDLEGMRIRTPTPAITAMLEHIGATPVGMPPTEIYESVERGVVDGNIMPWGPVGAFKLWEVLEYHYDARINPVSMYVLMNQSTYDSLPEDVRQVIDDMSGDWFTQRWGKWWSDTDQDAIDAARDNGNEIIEVSDEEREQWRERLQPVIDEYLEEESELGREEARALHEDMRAAVARCQE